MNDVNKPKDKVFLSAMTGLAIGLGFVFLSAAVGGNWPSQQQVALGGILGIVIGILVGAARHKRSNHTSD
jgi:hypothetical protein